MTYITAIIAIAFSFFSIGLMMTLYLNYIYVFPFIRRLDSDHKLKSNHSLYTIVLINSVLTFVFGLVILLLSYYFGSELFIKMFNVCLILAIVLLLIDTHILSKFGKDKKKKQTICNFEAPISLKLKDRLDFGRYLYTIETNAFEDTARIFAMEVDRLSTNIAYDKGLTGEAHKSEARRLFKLAFSLRLEKNNPDHEEAIEIRRLAQMKTPKL